MKEQIISQTVEFIANLEKIMPKPYMCPAGVLTNGGGFTIQGLREREMPLELIDRHLTAEEARDILRQMIEFDYALLLTLNLNLSINQSVACLSFIYQYGFIRFKNNFYEALKIKDAEKIKKIFHQFELLKVGDKEKNKGIIKRREKEIEKFFE